MEVLLQRSANPVPLISPSFLQRAYFVNGYKISITFGNTRHTWRQTHERWSNLASARTALKISRGDIVALSPFISAGDPDDLSATAQALKVLARCGSDRIEQSVAYSDPLADSPVIEVVPQLSSPVALFQNFSRILKLGAEKFMSILNDAGIQGQRPPRVYKVFISYKQEDMQPQVSHLRSALERREIKTFVDFTVEEGVEFQQAIDKAIEQSEIAVMIVSRNFHSSPWCLKELVKILECRKKWGCIVLPIFWGMDAKELQEQPTHFVDKIDHAAKDFKQEKPQQVQRWSEALRTLGRIKGWSVSSSSDKTEADVIEDLADKISAKLNP